MRLSTLLYLSLLSLFAFTQDRVILTGLLDGTGPGATPRAIELYVQGTVDLEDYLIRRYANGGTQGLAIELTGTYTDAFVYVVNGTESFAAAFGTAGDFAHVIPSSAVTGTGNDAFTLELDGTIIDQVGGAIGEGINIYQDSYLYRIDSTGADGGWVAEHWTNPGQQLLDDLTLTEIGAAVPFGTYTVGLPAARLEVTGEDLAEPDTGGGFTVTLSRPADTSVTFTYLFSGTADFGIDYLETQGGGTLTIDSGTLATTVNLDVIDDILIEGTETVILEILSVSDTTFTFPAATQILLLDDDLTTAPIPIHVVQGRSFSSPLAGDTVTVQAIVTGTFLDGLEGFYIQEEDGDTDTDSLTSEGIFVFADTTEVAVGDLVTVRALVREQFGQTQLGGAAGGSITIDSSGLPLPTPRTLTLPQNDTLLEALEGMRVAPQDLVITDVDQLASFGEVVLTSGQRLVQFTECNQPDSAAFRNYLDSLADDRILLDDGRNGRNRTPVLFAGQDTLDAATQVRAGQTISNLIGVLGYGFGQYRIQPTGTDSLTLSGNERPTAAPDVGGDLTIVSANLLNYFTTLGSRGADSSLELRRQEDKIVAGLCALAADIFGLIEVENDSNTIQRLVDTLSLRCGIPYDYVRNPNSGDDAIMVALIYRTDRIAEVGQAAALDMPEELFVGPGSNRVPLAQTFAVIDSLTTSFGTRLTVSVNHFKSKGSGCGPDDDDPTGGAGNCNGTRTAAARALADWLATDPTGDSTANVLILGDLNAYRMEEPIRVLEAAGYVNTKARGDDDRFPCGGGPPSFVFDGQWGSLDYILASDTLTPFITGATAWTVNAPELDELDYNLEGLSENLYAPDFYRFSDHDPIVVGLQFDRIIDNVTNSVARGSGVELRRLDRDTYTFDGLKQRGEYLLVNAAGQVVHQALVPVQGSRVSVAGLAPGIYFIALREPGAGQATFKVAVF